MNRSIPIIDPHQHFWDLTLEKHPWLCADHNIPFRYGDYTKLRGRNYLPDDYLKDTAGYQIQKTVYVETEWNSDDPLGETAWAMELHNRTGFPHAIVGQAWFMAENITAVLASQAACPLLRSIRQKPTATPSFESFRPGLPGSLGDPRFRNGFSGLASFGLHFDLQTPWWHLGEAADLARDFPETLIILNHTGLPSDRSNAGLKGWRSAMARFAKEPNTAVKISGICQPGIPWTSELNRAIVLETIHLFGVSRCMLASNFPVDKLIASFEQIYSGYLEILEEFSNSDKQKLFHDNAAIYYRPV